MASATNFPIKFKPANCFNLPVVVLLLSLSLSFFAGLATARPEKLIVGGWKPIDPKDQTVIELGKFAVDEQNKKTGTTPLIFQNVVSASKQVVAGTNYKLTIAATANGVSGNHEAVVFVSLAGVKRLESFN